VKNEVSVNIDPKKIDEAIQKVVSAEISKTLDDSRGDVLMAIVKKAMNEKASNYGQETILEKEIRTQLQGEAKSAVRNWVSKYSMDIRAKVEQALEENKSKLADGMVAAMIDSMYHSRFGVSINLSNPKKEEDLS
jgi:hypothetical protein